MRKSLALPAAAGGRATYPLKRAMLSLQITQVEKCHTVGGPPLQRALKALSRLSQPRRVEVHPSQAGESHGNNEANRRCSSSSQRLIGEQLRFHRHMRARDAHHAGIQLLSFSKIFLLLALLRREEMIEQLVSHADMSRRPVATSDHGVHVYDTDRRALGTYSLSIVPGKL